MMLGFLLARMAVDTFILEKHADFLRDFRGDTRKSHCGMSAMNRQCVRHFSSIASTN